MGAIPSYINFSLCAIIIQMQNKLAKSPQFPMNESQKKQA